MTAQSVIPWEGVQVATWFRIGESSAVRSTGALPGLVTLTITPGWLPIVKEDVRFASLPFCASPAKLARSSRPIMPVLVHVLPGITYQN